LKRTIRVIHGLADLHRDLPLENVDVYIGKAVADDEHVIARWKQHATKRGHRYGLILFTCDADSAKKLEAVAIRVLRRLKEQHRLCVGAANVSETSGGRPSANEHTAIYMTWTVVDRPSIYIRPTVAIIDDVAARVGNHAPLGVRSAQIATGLGALKQPGHFERIMWLLP
jgi:hypothetical protein